MVDGSFIEVKLDMTAKSASIVVTSLRHSFFPP